MKVTMSDISIALIELGLEAKPVCVHSSLSSFGWVEGGAESIIQAFLNQNCTILVPTFYSNFAGNPPHNQRP